MGLVPTAAGAPSPGLGVRVASHFMKLLDASHDRSRTALSLIARNEDRMCGIFGSIGRSLPQPSVENVLRVLEHRGPDGTGVFTDASAQLTLAHTRLAVIDLVTGSQPLTSEDGKIVLAANGEIYDFERIRNSLEAKGRRFKTKSDSEIIIALYEEFGLGCFEHLRGEFAFLLYDKRKRLLIAARDRFGIKPLYFSRLSGGLVFGSEIKAIFASGLVEPKLDATGLDPLLDRARGTGRFPFQGIEHVPPASYLTVDVETLESRISRYWSPEIPAESAQPVTEPADREAFGAARIVLEKLEEAVRLRLRADVPVGLYLSGGIDSSFVGALMKRNRQSDLHSFSISFLGSDASEQEFTRKAADHLGTAHHELQVSKDMLWRDLENCLWYSELPFVSLAPVGKFLLSKEARKSVTVVLTGEGADEVFLGYRSYFQRAIDDTRSGAANSSPQLRRLKRGKLGTAILSALSLLIFHRDRRPPLAAARSAEAEPEPNSGPLINAVQEARLAGMPLDILCYLGDREEMAHSLEARLPFLDHDLYDAAKSIPVDLKIRGGIEKAVLRDAAKGILPEELRLRPKRGFMQTSDIVDFYGTDRARTEALRGRYLSRAAFGEAQMFSYRAFLLAALLAKLPAWLPALKRLRRDSNKVVMYMLQAHMLHRMFVAEPRWRTQPAQVTDVRATRLIHEIA
jgi:asparagine synthase (glutamine-hydrolysing)